MRFSVYILIVYLSFQPKVLEGSILLFVPCTKDGKPTEILEYESGRCFFFWVLLVKAAFIAKKDKPT